MVVQRLTIHIQQTLHHILIAQLAPNNSRMYYLKIMVRNCNGGKSERWVKYLEHHKLRNDEIYNKEKILSMTQNVKEKIRTNNDNNTKRDMNLKIITTLTNPNKEWKLKREKYLVRKRR